MKDLLKINKKIVLASKSPRRKKLLEQIGLSFCIITSDIDEKELATNIEPREYAQQLARKKAIDVAGKIDDEAIVIGADTIVVLGGKILNKPEDPEDAQRMLGILSNNTHTVYTGVAIVESKSGYILSDVKSTNVTFRRLSEDEISAYVATGAPLDKAGAYGIQDDFGAVFISHIEGCYYNIVGLPLEMLYGMLSEFSG